MSTYGGFLFYTEDGISKCRLDDGTIIIVASEQQARVAFEQFASEPHPGGFEETYPDWADLAPGTKELWYRVATAVLNSKVVG